MNIEKITQILSSKKVIIGALIVIVLSIITLIFATSLKQGREERIEQTAQTYRERLETYPILNDLPYKSTFYSIEPRNEDGEIVLYVFTSLPYQRAQAVEMMNHLETNASSKYKVVFYNFNNPLLEEGAPDEDQ